MVHAALQKAKEAVKKERQLEKLHQQLHKGTPRHDGLTFATCLQLALMHEASGLAGDALRIYQALLKNKSSSQVRRLPQLLFPKESLCRCQSVIDVRLAIKCAI